jgi:hypothetical protein
MKRLIFEVLLLIALAAAGPYVWYLHNKVGADTAKVQTMTERGEEAEKKLEALTQSLEAAQREVEPLRLQSQQLQALRASFASGQTLKDLEAAYAKEKTLSPERHLGLGVLQILSTGKANEAAVDSLKKAMTASDWGSRKPIICAAQNALSYAGQAIDVLAECKPQASKPAPAAEPAEKKAGG